MAEAKWSGVLSTTEPRNDVGIIKVRQGNINSEIAEFQIVQNNKPYDLTGLTVYFCASFGLNLVEKPAVVINTTGGRIQYTFDDDSMQSVGRQKGYFSIKKAESKIDSTQDFEFQVESSLMTRSIDGKSYIYKLSTLIKVLDDFIKNGQNNFNVWFESVKEILYGVDPGGSILRELIEARKNSSGNIFASLKARLDKNEDDTAAQLAQNETTNRRNAETPLFIPTYDGGNEVVHPSAVYFGNAWNGYKYWQAFTPYTKTNDKLENPSIAVSNDGVQWFIPSGFVNPIDIPSPTQLTDGYHMSDTELVYNSVTNKLECYYRLSKNNVIDTILRKTSSDGKTWTDREVVYETIGTQLTLSPTIYFNGSTYIMWFVQSYEGNLSIMRTTSPTATLGSWSTPTVCTLNYKKSSEGLIPWHIQISFSKNKFHLVLNSAKNTGIGSPTRVLLIGESNDGKTFNDIEVILEPTPRVSSMWDNVEIYRSSLVFNGSSYMLYYSANGTSGWKVGLLAGNSPKTVNAFNTKREVLGNELIEKSLILNEGESLFFNTNKTSYIRNNELKLLISGIAGGRIVLNTDGSYSFLTDAGNLNKISVSKISSPGNAFGLVIEDKMRVVSTTSPATFKMVQTGVAGAGIRQTAEGYVEVLTDTETTGHILAKTFLLDSLGGSVGKKGAIGWDINGNRPIYNDGLSARALSNFKAIAPTTQTSTGVHGDYSVDVNNLYVCTSTNNWKKIPLSAW